MPSMSGSPSISPRSTCTRRSGRAPRAIQRRQRLAEQHHLRTTHRGGGMRGTRVDGDQADGALQQRHEARNRQIIGGIVKSGDIRQRRDFLVELHIRGPCPATRSHAPDAAGAGIRSTSAQRSFGQYLLLTASRREPAPHRALVADLHQDQRHARQDRARAATHQDRRAAGRADLQDGSPEARCEDRQRLRTDDTAAGMICARRRHCSRRMFAGQQRMIFDIDDVARPECRRASRRGRAASLPSQNQVGPDAARAQVPHHPLLIRAQPVRCLAAAHAEDLAHSRLSAQQRLAPGSRGHDIHGRAKSACSTRINAVNSTMSPKAPQRTASGRSDLRRQRVPRSCLRFSAIARMTLSLNISISSSCGLNCSSRRSTPTSSNLPI